MKRLRENIANEDGFYSIQFFNRECWNKELSANKIGVYKF